MNWELESKDSQPSIALLDRDVASHLPCDCLAACQTHTNVIILDVVKVLLHFELQERLKEHLLPALLYPESCINHLSLKLVAHLILKAFQTVLGSHLH